MVKQGTKPKNRDYINGVYFIARNWVRISLKSMMDDYKRERINLDKILGIDKARHISRIVHTPSNYASIKKLVETEEALAELWKSLRHLVTGGNQRKMMTENEYVSAITEILLNEIPVIGPFSNRFKHVKPLEDIIKIDTITGKIILPTTRWKKSGIKVSSSISFNSLPKAIRSAQHAIDSLIEEYQKNKEIIEDLERIVIHLPKLGRLSTDEERNSFITELFAIAERLKLKRHALKIEARTMLSSSETLDAIDLLKTSYDPEAVRFRRERNWPAARAKISAARDRFVARNIEIIENLTPGMYVRKQKLLAGYEQYVAVHNYIDRVISNYVNLLYLLDREAEYINHVKIHGIDEIREVVNMINNWLVPYVHDRSYNHLLWAVGERLLDSLRELNRGAIKEAMDEVLNARREQLNHYQALLLDKEGKGIEIGTEKINIPPKVKRELLKENS